MLAYISASCPFVCLSVREVVMAIEFAPLPDFDLKVTAVIADLPNSEKIAASITEASVAVGAAKTILLHHRVKAFTGADVVALAALILAGAKV